MEQIRKKGWILAMTFALVVALTTVAVVAAAGAQVTSGEFGTNASGHGNGHAASDLRRCR